MERIIRIVAGLVLLGLAATGTVGWWGWLGVVPLATGALGWCPPYAIFGINTCAIKK
jgi:membrane protein implicated in regulation of membrane protease activity